MTNRARTVNEWIAGFGRYAVTRHRGQAGTYRHARRIEQNFRRSPERLRAEQDRAVATIVDHAFRSSRFYRRRFGEVGFQPGDVRGCADLPRLPEVTKLDLVNNVDDILCQPKDQLHASATGGTTGVPLRFYRDARCLLVRGAIDLVTPRYFGWRDGQWQGWLWGASRDLLEPAGLRARLIQYAGDRMFFLDVLHLDNTAYRRFADQLRRYRPTYVSAYPSLAYDFAQRIETGEVDAPRVPAISLTAEPVYGFQREKIRRWFADRVYERYGSREMGTAALECPEENGMHYFTESVCFETVDRGAEVPGKSLLVTDLQNYGMPLIRYQTGDFGELDEAPCPCGWTAPRLRNIQGRETDIVWRKDGRGVAGFVVTTFAAGLPIGGSLQFVQEALDRIVIRVEGSPGAWKDGLMQLVDICRQKIGTDVCYDIQYVGTIEREPSGKYRYVVSRVSRPC